MASWGLITLALLAKATFTTLHHAEISKSRLHQRKLAESGNLQALYGVTITVVCHQILVLPEHDQQ